MKYILTMLLLVGTMFGQTVKVGILTQSESSYAQSLSQEQKNLDSRREAFEYMLGQKYGISGNIEYSTDFKAIVPKFTYSCRNSYGTLYISSVYDTNCYNWPNQNFIIPASATFVNTDNLGGGSGFVYNGPIYQGWPSLVQSDGGSFGTGGPSKMIGGAYTDTITIDQGGTTVGPSVTWSNHKEE